jgi:hypothetical protein
MTTDMAIPDHSPTPPRRFKVSNRFKKEVTEIEVWRKGDSYFIVEQEWRWGSFIVIVGDGEDAPVHGQASLDLEDYKWEEGMHDTRDCCYCSMRFEGSSPDEDENEAEGSRVKEGYCEGYGMWLEEDGWCTFDRNFTINGVVDVEEQVDTKPDGGPVEP